MALLDVDEVLENAKRAKDAGASRFCMGAAWREVKDGQAFDSVLAQADVLTLHCPLTPQTRHLIGAKEIARIKPGAILINTARGPLVDESAVLQGLQSGRLGGAALDVLEVEPPPSNHPLLHADHPNLLVTPHVAWASASSVQRLKSVILKNIAAYAQGKPINVVS